MSNRVDHGLAARTLGRLLELVQGGGVTASRGQVERLEGARIALDAQAPRRQRKRTPRPGDTRDEPRV